MDPTSALGGHQKGWRKGLQRWQKTCRTLSAGRRAGAGSPLGQATLLRPRAPHAGGHHQACPLPAGWAVLVEEAALGVGGPAQAPPRPSGPRGILGASSPPTPADPDVQGWGIPKDTDQTPTRPGSPRGEKAKETEAGAEELTWRRRPQHAGPEKAWRGAQDCRPAVALRGWPGPGACVHPAGPTHRHGHLGRRSRARAGRRGLRYAAACSGPPGAVGRSRGSRGLLRAPGRRRRRRRPTDRTVRPRALRACAPAAPPPGPALGGRVKGEDPGPRRFSVGPTRRGACRLEFLGRQNLTRPALHRLGAGIRGGGLLPIPPNESDWKSPERGPWTPDSPHESSESPLDPTLYPHANSHCSSFCCTHCLSLE